MDNTLNAKDKISPTLFENQEASSTLDFSIPKLSLAKWKRRVLWWWLQYIANVFFRRLSALYGLQHFNFFIPVKKICLL